MALEEKGSAGPSARKKEMSAERLRRVLGVLKQLPEDDWVSRNDIVKLTGLRRTEVFKQLGVMIRDGRVETRSRTGDKIKFRLKKPEAVEEAPRENVSDGHSDRSVTSTPVDSNAAPGTFSKEG